MQMNDLRALYQHELQDIRDGEIQLAQLLPRMAEAAHDQDLKKQLQEHGRQTRVHRERLETILEGFETKSDDVTCEGIRGIEREAERYLRNDVGDDVRDAALLAVAQKIEHYEIAGYGALRTYAELLGDEKGREALQKTLDEEGGADKRLTSIAKKSVNPGANA